MSPDGSKKSTPEERLLSLIRGKQAPVARPAAEAYAPIAAGRPPARPVDSGHPALAGRARPGFRPTGSSRGASRVSARSSSPLWALNLGLSALILAECAVLVRVVVSPLEATAVETPSAVAPHVAAEKTPVPKEEPLPSLAQAVSRPLFQLQGGTGGGGGRPAASPSDQSKTLSARLSLIGVVSGNPPQAIIEDSQTKKSYFVSAGQTVVEGATVLEVRDNHVVLDLNGERIDLAL